VFFFVSEVGGFDPNNDDMPEIKSFFGWPKGELEGP
jgi:hypothetical protein